MKPKIFSKLFLKLLGSYFLVIAFLAAFLVFFVFKTVHPHYLETTTEHLHELASLQADAIHAMVMDENWTALNRQIQEQSQKIHKRITIIGTDGRVLADSEEDPATMDNHLNRAEILHAQTNGMGASLRFSNTTQKEMLYVAIPLRENNQTIAYVRISFSLAKIQALLHQLKSEIWEIVLIGLLLSLPLAAFFSNQVTQPIRNLAHYARRVAKGDLEVKIYESYKDEMRELANSFNLMLDQIRQLIQEQRQQKESLQAILASIPEALFVLNAEGEIRIENEQFSIIKNRFWKQPTHTNDRYYWEIIREASLNQAVKEIVEKDEPRSQFDLEFEDHFWLLTAVSMPQNPDFSYIFLLSDITKIKNAEQLKRDLVTNVSHELRTPLTSIKGFVETLADEIGSENTYLSIIRRNTNRLIRIVEDILTLSELEKKLDFDFQPIQLSEMISHVLVELTPKAEAKHLQVQTKLPSVGTIQGDVFRLEQACINIVDNAIKYTEEGTITISTEDRENEVLLRVCDSGIGIPPQHIDRIFERFYVVDKSRSRKTGGTGLGLSIVKHVVQRHGGRIEVKSQAGQGTCFSLYFPKA